MNFIFYWSDNYFKDSFIQRINYDYKIQLRFVSNISPPDLKSLKIHSSNPLPEGMKMSDITRKGIFQKFLEKGGWKKADRGFNLKKGLISFYNVEFYQNVYQSRISKHLDRLKWQISHGFSLTPTLTTRDTLLFVT